MSKTFDDIISLIETRLRELHPPRPPRTDRPDIQFSIRSTLPHRTPEPILDNPVCEESPLPDWVQTLLGRIGIRKDERVPPNLNAANPSFAARILIAVRDKYRGNPAPLYLAAHVDRRLYSKIISDERRPVSKNTALAFAFAMHLSTRGAQELLQSAGHALSPTDDRDVVLSTCLDKNLYDISQVNDVLRHFRMAGI